LTNPTNPEPFFIAENRALDMVNSVAAPWGEQIEWLGSGYDLLSWLEKSGLVARDVAKRMRDETPPGALDEVAAQARDLREWFRIFVAANAGRRIEPSALAELGNLNRLIAGDATYRQIEPLPAKMLQPAPDGQGGYISSLHLQRHRKWRGAQDLLLPIAEAMSEMICGVNFEQVKNCEGPNCTLWFHDTSKNRSRRWCTMAMCGNRAKAAAHRARMRSDRQE